MLIKVKAFSMNNSEQILRFNKFYADYIRKPISPDIESVGEIADLLDSDFTIGQKIVVFVRSMRCSFHESYT